MSTLTLSLDTANIDEVLLPDLRHDLMACANDWEAEAVVTEGDPDWLAHELAAALRAAEWIVPGVYVHVGCPLCFHLRERQHTSDCPIGNALSKYDAIYGDDSHEESAEPAPAQPA